MEIAADFEDYKKAAEQADTAKMQETQESIEFMLEHCRYRAVGTYVFDLIFFAWVQL